MKKSLFALLIGFVIGFMICFVSFLYCPKWTEKDGNNTVIVMDLYGHEFTSICD